MTKKENTDDNKVGKLDGISGYVPAFYSFILGNENLKIENFLGLVSQFLPND